MALAVGALLVLLALSRAVRTITGVALRPVLLSGNLTVIPAHTNFSAFSPTFLTVVTVVPLLIYLAGRPRADNVTVPVWDGGMVAFKPRMRYSAMTFSAPTRVTFDALYRPSVSLHRASDDPVGRSGPVHASRNYPPTTLPRSSASAVSGSPVCSTERVSRSSPRVQSGHVPRAGTRRSQRAQSLRACTWTAGRRPLRSRT